MLSSPANLNALPLHVVAIDDEITFITRENLDHYVNQQHIMRYCFASNYVSGKNALDIGCGIGYGPSFLARKAKHIVGIDSSNEAITFAKQCYQTPNTEYRKVEAGLLPYGNHSWEVIVSFEVIEHVKDPDQFLLEIKRVLAENGTFLCSTPRGAIWWAKAPYHEKEFRPRAFSQLLARHFRKVELFGQYLDLKLFWRQSYLDATCHLAHQVRQILSRLPGGETLSNHLRRRMRQVRSPINLKDASLIYKIDPDDQKKFPTHAVVPLKWYPGKVLKNMIAVCYP